MKKNNGFTLLEILVSVGILTILSTLLAQVLFTTTRVNQRTKYITDIKQNGNFALDVIGRMIRAASSIETLCTTQPYATSVIITNTDKSITTLSCISDGTSARIASVTGANTSYLTAANLTLGASGDATCGTSTLRLSCPPAAGIQRDVTVSFTLGETGLGGSDFDTSASTFNTTVHVRTY